MDNENFETFSESSVDTVKSSVAVWTLVLGILSIVCCAPCGIASIIVWAINKDKFADADKGKAKAGLICAIIGVVLWVLGLIISAVSGASMTAILNEMQ